VVVLEKKSLSGGCTVVFLVTAFYVGGNSTRRKLQKKYEKRVSQY